MTRTVLLLTFNEAAGVESYGADLRTFETDEILAMDGGSTDGTVQLLEAHGIRVVRQRYPGRGAAIREGVFATVGESIVLFSPDGNEDPADVPRLFQLLESGCDMAVGSRFLPAAANEEDDKLLPVAEMGQHRADPVVRDALGA